MKWSAIKYNPLSNYLRIFWSFGCTNPANYEQNGQKKLINCHFWWNRSEFWKKKELANISKKFNNTIANTFNIEFFKFDITWAIDAEDENKSKGYESDVHKT